MIRGQQHISPSDLAAFASRFGEPYHHALMPQGADPVHPINIPAGGYWHSDVTFAPTPPAATLLHAATHTAPRRRHDLGEHVPRLRDTVASDAYLPRRAHPRHDFDHFYRYPMGDSLETDQFILDQKKVQPLPTHPVVRAHPETGRKALFVNDSFTTNIEELSHPESDTILEFLHRHATRPELTCRYRWSVGDIAFWDNRCTMHYPIDDWNGSLDFTQESSRQMNRITIQAEQPR